MTRQTHNGTRRQRPRGGRAKVDDEPFVRQAVAEILSGLGFPVVDADDGAVAIELLRQGLRPSSPALRGIATVVLTGSLVDREALGRELGGVRVMAKPVGYDQLLALHGEYCARAA